MKNGNTHEVVLAVIIATIVFFILIAFAVVYFSIYRRKRKEHQQEMIDFKEQFENQLLQSQIEVQEQTFQHIGKELHDNIGQLLSTAKMLLSLIEVNSTESSDIFKTVNATLGGAINELRSLSKSLDKEWLEQFNFEENLRTEITRINAGKKAFVDFKPAGELPLAAGEQIILFRIVQEAVQNAIKHGRPKNMLIEMKEGDIHYSITISDNGAGFNLQEKENGMGIANMKHRVALLGGTITWNSIPDAGTTVNIFLPLKKLAYENNDRAGG